MKKIIQFLVSMYLKRHVCLMSDPGLSIGNSDYIYVWTSHEIAPKVYKAILDVLEEERSNRYVMEAH